MGVRIFSLLFWGASRARLFWEGSSMFTLIRSAYRPRAWVRRGSAPGMAFTWTYPQNRSSSRSFFKVVSMSSLV